MPQREDNGQPANDEEESGGFESRVGRGGRGFIGSLLRVALKLDRRPVSRDNHEEVLYGSDRVSLEFEKERK